MDADDLVEILFGPETEPKRAPGLEAGRPAGDDLGDCLVRSTADQIDRLLAGHAPQGRDLLPDRAEDARHGQIDPRTEGFAVQPGSMEQEADSRTRARMREDEIVA